MGQIKKGKFCPGCGQVCDGIHLDKSLRPPKEPNDFYLHPHPGQSTQAEHTSEDAKGTEGPGDGGVPTR